MPRLWTVTCWTMRLTKLSYSNPIINKILKTKENQNLCLKEPQRRVCIWKDLHGLIFCFKGLFQSGAILISEWGMLLSSQERLLLIQNGKMHVHLYFRKPELYSECLLWPGPSPVLLRLRCDRDRLLGSLVWWDSYRLYMCNVQALI